MRFNHKTAIVTGAGQGIGFAICRQLIKEGATVVLNDIDSSLCNNAANQLNDYGPGTCLPVPGDASGVDCIQAMITQATANSHQLDIVIANAGITLFGDFFTYSPGSFHRVMQVNLAGTFFLAQAAANLMKDQPAGGSILFTSSVTARLINTWPLMV